MDAITDQQAGTDTVPAGSDRVPSGSRLVRPGQPVWLQRHVRLITVSDGLAATLATLVAHLWAFGLGPASLQVRSLEIPYVVAPIVIVPAWLVVLATSRCYHVGPFGFVEHEARRVVRAGAQFIALIAVAYFIVHMERLGREFLSIIVPLAVLATLAGRAGARYLLRRQREQGDAMRPALLVGPPEGVRTIVEHVNLHPGEGITPVAALAPGIPTTDDGANVGVPIIGTADDPMPALASTGADVLLIAGDLAPGQLRRLTWDLEGTGVDVLVAPAAAQLGSPLMDVRPVAGLPLLYVDRSSLPTGSAHDAQL